MKIDVLLGLQWGDEGKGKIVDVLTPHYDMIARFQGGPNAGHSLEFNHIKHILHTIPSGIFHEDKINIIGNGVVIDPVVFMNETESLTRLGIDPLKNLYVSKKAHLILPSHRILDAASEAAKGSTKIGSTLKGIGPTYMDKTGRNGIRVGDIAMPGFREKYRFLTNKHREILNQYNYSYDIEEYEEEWFRGIEKLKSFRLIESEHLINNYMERGKRVLAEGAQGTLLDIDFGSYPFVTSSNTICAGACTGLGIAPSRIGEVIGIVKAYCTRVGSGPFPTELKDKTGDRLRKQGLEFGSTTGRPRRCGWLDLPALKYSIMLNGVTQLIITKADVLSGFRELKVCTAYKLNGKTIDYLPFDISDEQIEPVFETLNGWDEDIAKIHMYDKLPENFKKYIGFIEKETGVKVSIISTGPGREQAIFPFPL